MFRELSRKNKQLPAEECIRLLQTEKRGILSVLGDNGYPYGMPMNHYYHDGDGCLYFHCGTAGHRLDALKKDSRVSFCLYDSGEAKNGGWALHFNSVVVFGRICIIEDKEEIRRIIVPLCRKFTDDAVYIQKEIDAALHRTLLLRLVPEHICGKHVIES